MPTDDAPAIAWIWKTSLRYFFSGNSKKMRFAGLSAAGIAAGFVAVIVIMGIMNGLQEGYLRDMLEIDSYHIRIYPESGASTEEILTRLEGMNGIRSSFPFLETKGVIRTSYGTTFPVVVKGVPAGYYDLDEGMRTEAPLLAGRFDTSSEHTVVVGRLLAADARLMNGSTAELLFLGEGRTVTLVPLTKQVEVEGVFHSGFPEIDSSICYVSVDLLTKALQRSQAMIGVKLYQSSRAGRIADLLSEQEGILQAESWQERNEALYSALMLEKYSMLILLFLIFVVVIFNIRNSLERLIFLQKKDIGVLTAIGAERRHILVAFLLQGVYVALLGTVLGIGLGLTAARTVNDLLSGIGMLVELLTGIRIFFFSYSFPVVVIVHEIVAVAAAVLVMSTTAAWMAVRKILKFDPVRILHYE